MAIDADLQETQRAVLGLATATAEMPTAKPKTRRLESARPAIFEPPPQARLRRGQGRRRIPPRRGADRPGRARSCS